MKIARLIESTIVLYLIAWMFYISQDARVFGLAALTAPLIGMLRQIYRSHFPPSVDDYEIQKLKLQLKLKRK